MTTYNNSISSIARPDFLSIYAGIIKRIGEANNLITPERQESLIDISQQPSLYETAYLKNGAEGIIEIVCEDLLRLGFLGIENDLIRVATYFKHTSHLEPLEQEIFDYLHVPKTIIELKESPELNKAIAPHCQQYHQSLINKGYLRSGYKKYLTVGFGGLAILVLAILKPMSGLLASYRYIMLLAMVAMPKASLAIAATAWFTTRSKSASLKLTSKGKAYLKH
ncbi:MAG: TIGR04222 domain-containing membrane protein [Pleurocapsa sp.]